MNYTNADINKILNSKEFNKNYEKYKQQNGDLIKILFFLDTIKLNKEYYKLNICNSINDIKIKNINGQLNKLTELNVDEIKKEIINNIKKDKSTLNLTINSIIEKSILQKNYLNQYIYILKEINDLFDSRNIIKTIIKSYDIIFNECVNINIIDNIYKKQYLLLCEKNKKIDNFIGYCELIYILEKNQLLENNIEKMIDDIFDKIDKNDSDIYKYIMCIYNIYSSYNIINEDIIKKLENIKNNTNDKKIKFKIMDIFDIYK